MMPGKSQTPALRFAGFTGDWVERKLGGLTDITTGALDANAMTPDGEYDFYTCSLQVYKIDQYAFEGPAITIAGNGYVGCLHLADGRFNAYQRTYVLSNFKASREFLYEEIGRELPAKVTREARNGNIPYIVRNMLTELEISLPCSTEQSTIGRFFRKVDALITQQQKKVEKLQGLKKGLMKKMFPRGGRTLPEVRFAGFDEEWVERTVKEVCSISTGKSNTQDRACDGKYPFYVRSAVIERSHKYLYDEEAVLTVGDGAIGKIFHYVNGKYDLHQRVYRMYDFSGIDARFFYYIFSKDFGKRANSMTAKTSVDSVRMEMIADMEFAMPEKSEQSSIGRLFRKLDDLITLHGQKLEKLRHVKQALLDRMFV